MVRGAGDHASAAQGTRRTAQGARTFFATACMSKYIAGSCSTAPVPSSAADGSPGCLWMRLAKYGVVAWCVVRLNGEWHEARQPPAEVPLPRGIAQHALAGGRVSAVARGSAVRTLQGHSRNRGGRRHCSPPPLCSALLHHTRCTATRLRLSQRPWPSVPLRSARASAAGLLLRPSFLSLRASTIWSGTETLCKIPPNGR